MKKIKDALNVKSIEIQPDVFLHLLNIEKINDDLKKHMDDVLIDIYSKGQDSEIELVKLKLKKYFNSKKDSTLEIGSIAEFFIHLYLNLIGFQQECLYKNLEENAIKKGFDGFYTKCDEIWIMESKSGNITTKNICHKEKINEAYSDLSKKFSGKTSNNPWENAFSHAKQAGSDSNLLSAIKKLENMYTREEYTIITDYNIIPCSTIFFDAGTFTHINIDNLKESIMKFLKGKKFKKINIICVNKKTKELFLEYLKS